MQYVEVKTLNALVSGWGVCGGYCPAFSGDMGARVGVDQGGVSWSQSSPPLNEKGWGGGFTNYLPVDMNCVSA